MVTIKESGVVFGDFPEDNFYRIEHSAGHKFLGDGFKMVEFVFLDDKKLFLLEAKSSIPKPAQEKNWDDFWDGITEKFENGLLLQIMGCVKRNNAVYRELPDNLATMDWEKTSLQLRLVIPEVPTKHLPQMTDKFRQQLHKLRKIWNIDNRHIVVINSEKAQHEGLLNVG